MPSRSQKHRTKKQTNNSSIVDNDRFIPSNMNAYNQTTNNLISYLESIGNLIIQKLNGTERNHLKQQLSTTINHLLSSSSRKNFKELLNDFNTFDCHYQRQYRTIGIGHDNNISSNTYKTTIVTPKPINSTDNLNDQVQIPMAIKSRKSKQINSSRIIDNDVKKTPHTITRTICTRSSKLNTLNNNNNEEQINHIILNRARKHRSSLINNSSISNEMNTNSLTTEQSDLNLQKPIGNDVFGNKISRKKLQSSVPSSSSIEYFKTTNEF